ncbi:MAG: TrbI/VirB10 family protein [Bryobacteraceae bacterium]
MAEETQAAGSQPVPDPEALKPTGLSNAHKRYVYDGVTAALAALILANVVGSKQSPAPMQAKQTAPGQRENPSPAQIRDWENSLKQAEAQLEREQKDRDQQLALARASQQSPTLTLDQQITQAEALQEAAAARQKYQQTYGNGGGQNAQAQQKSQTELAQAEQAYKSLFADNMIRQEPAAPANSQPSAAVPPTPAPEASPSPAAVKASDETRRKPLDFNPAAQSTVWLPEGTVMEAVLTNRLDGDAVGPVDCMITSDVYQPATRVLLIPQGARVLGEASAVSSLGQARLAVAFHRIIVPGLRTYSIPLDKLMPALGQTGDVGLHDKVNSHYASIFGSSLAIGAIGGLAQIGNGYSGFGYDPSVEIRNGMTQSMGQSSSRILDRFLNRMPTITIREGTRVRIILTDDLQLPTYDSMRKGAS